MPLMHDFRFLLCATNVPANSTGPWHRYGAPNTRLLAELDVQSGTMDWGLNRAGQCRLEVAKDSFRNALANDLITGSPVRMTIWGNTIPPGATTLWIEHQGTMIWGGLIWDLASNSDNATVSLTAEEFTGYYDRLRVWNTFPNTNVNSTMPTLVQALTNIGGQYSIRMPVVQGHPYWTSPFVPLNASYVPSAAPYANTDTFTPQWYEFENHKVGDLIRSLQAMKTGFDIRQGIRYDTTNSGWEACMVMNTPRAGNQSDRYLSREISWGEGTSNTAKRIDWTISARQTVTRAKATGLGERSQQVRVIYQQMTNVTDGTHSLSDPFGAQHAWGAPYLDGLFQDPQLRDAVAVNGKAHFMLEYMNNPLPVVRAEIDLETTGLHILPRTPDSITSLVESPIGIGDYVMLHVVDAALDMRSKMVVQGMAFRYDRRQNVTCILDLQVSDESFS